MPIKHFGLSGSGGLGSAIGFWNGSKNLADGGGKSGGAGWGPNGGRGGWDADDGGLGGDSGGDKVKLSLTSSGFGLFFNFSSLFLMTKCTAGGFDVFFISSQVMSFFPTSISFN